MQLELTVDVRGDRRDVALSAPPGATLADVAAALGVASSDAAFWDGDRLLARDVPLADAGLRMGCILRVGSSGARSGRPAVLALHVVGGPDAGRTIALDRGRLHIGRDPACDLVLADVDVSRRHAVIETRQRDIVLHDLDSMNGTQVDGCHVPPEGSALRPGAVIRIGDSFLTVAGPGDAPATLQPAADGRRLVIRPPRHRPPGSDLPIEFPTPEHASRPRGVQWVTALLPAAAGGAIAWVAHSPQFLLFALLSPVMMLSTALGDRLHWRRSRRVEAATFRRRRVDAERRIDEGLQRETAARRAAAPDAGTLLVAVSLPTCRVWERRRNDDDVLLVRLGTADLTSALHSRTGSSSEPAGTVGAVPLTVDLRHGPLGLAGPADVVGASARWVVGQLAALHSPADVGLALLLDPERAADWEWARWLPHLRGRVAGTEDEWPALVTQLAASVDQRRGQLRVDPGGWAGPWLVLVVDRMSRLSDVPGLADLLAQGTAAGLTAVCVATEETALPTSCATVARVAGDTGSRVHVRSQVEPTPTRAVLDGVSPSWADAVARGLAPLVDSGVSGAAGIPDTCRLPDVLGFDELTDAGIAARWVSSDGGAAAAVGRSGDGLVEVDLVRDGPHALIAGTTGSGKSELLQALVAGLAVNHPPSEVNLLLIDYKGGAAFTDCLRLPHTAGLVTDLDPYLTERALRSLRSELRRRERLFAAVGAADLAAYRAAGIGEPVPRLVIVVDEFASLVDELPDFVRGLVGVAQRGRSLGVHLVLATQRPGRAVSPEIRANTSLRIALRVTDPAESTDVIAAPDAAGIDRSLPGRGYLRTGTELSCFQAAHVGATESADGDGVHAEPLGAWRRRGSRLSDADGPTDILRLVDAVQAAAVRTGWGATRSPWLPPLPDLLPVTDLEDDPGSPTTVPIAQVDLPDEQRRATLSVDLAAGTTVLAVGTGRSGRTSLLAALACGAAGRLGPDELGLHVIDSSGALAAAAGALPHSATVLGPDDLTLAPRLLHRLERECARRLGEQSAGSVPHERPARLLLLVDGWDAVTGALDDVDAAAGTEAMARLLRIGAGAGLTVAVAGDRALLAPRFSAGFAERVVLRLADRSDYALAGIALRDIPTALPPGRGLRATDGAVLQIAHVSDAGDPDGLRQAVAAVVDRWPPVPSGTPASHAVRIRGLPRRVALRDLPPGRGLVLGLAGDQAQPLIFDPFATVGRLLVAGPPRSGRTTLLRSLVHQAGALGICTVVAAPARSPLAATARDLAVRLTTPADDELGPVPNDRVLLLVDDSEAFLDTPAGDELTRWVRAADAPLCAVVAGGADDLATTYRGVGAEVRRSRCGILLRPGPVDGELLGVRLARRPSTGPPGRGIAVGDPSWGALFDDGEPVPVQVAEP